MEKTNEKTLKYVAAVLFLLPLLKTSFIYRPLTFFFDVKDYFWLINGLQNDYGWGFITGWGREWSALLGLGCVVLAVGACIKNKRVLVAGIFLNLINQIQDVLGAMGYFFELVSYGWLELTEFMYVCSKLLILLAFICILFSFLGMGSAEAFKKKFSSLFEKLPLENMHIYAIILVVTSIFLALIRLIIVGHFSLEDVWPYAAIFGAALILGYVEYGNVKLVGSGNDVKTAGASCGALNLSSVERLFKLKELLDGGMISQEEFDEKKKQILGL